MFLKRPILLLAIFFCAVLYVGNLVAMRVRPAQANVGVKIEGSFTEGSGWYPGEPLFTRHPLRAWGSWVGSDENNGSLTLGPFPAPSLLRFGLGGYPGRNDIQLYVEHLATRKQVRIDHPDVGERWRIADCPLPREWRGQPVVLVAIDTAKSIGGWIALTEPIRGGRGDGPAAMLESLSAWSINGLLLGVLWLASARGLAARSALAPHWIPLVAAGVVAAAGYLAFWAYFAHPALGRVTSLALLLTGIAVLWRVPRAAPAEPDQVTVGRLAIVIGVFYLALLHLFPTSQMIYELATNRFRDGLPADNFLPHTTAARLFAGEPLKRADADWLSSDRPPLQAGWQLLTWPETAWLKLNPITASGTAAIWLQLIWIAAAYGLFRTLGIGVRRTAAWIAVLSLSGFFLQHSVFTWPKLSAGAFACGAFGLWVLPLPEHRRRGEILTGAALAALAWLSHGGVAFSLIVLGPWVAWRALHGEGRTWAQAALGFGLLTAPWLAYQHFYDPPGNRLLKWHLGGQVPKDQRGTWETIRSNYAALTWAKLVEHKRLNFRSQTTGDWSGLVDLEATRVKNRRDEEFSHTGRALTWWLGGLVLAPLVVGRIARRPDARALGRMHTALFLWIALTIPLWCLLLFEGGSAVVHQGSFAVMLTAFVLLSAWFDLVSRRWLAVLALLQGMSLVFTWAVGNHIVKGSPTPLALALVVAGGVTLAGFVVLGWRETNLAPASEPMAAPPATVVPTRHERTWTLLAGLGALLPFAWCLRSFADLWWFGDDWDLIERIDKIGFWRWTVEPFAENFVPLFKLLWGGLVFASGGSYFPMIAILWLTHALNTALFARVLRAAGFSWTSAALALAVFALSFANIETLAWSVQWSALLAITFFLLAANWLFRRAPDGPVRWPSLLVLALLSAASALAFARGVLTGAALAALCLLPAGHAVRGWPRWRTAAACLLPAVGVAAVIYFYSPGNHRAALGAHWREAVAFGASYWGATPLHRLLELGEWDPNSVLFLGAVKLVLIGWVLRHATATQRHLLVLLLLLDLGNAVLLGIGRYQTGLPASNGERYQYNALLCTMPFLALAFENWLAGLPAPRLRRTLAALLLLLIALRVAHGWPRAAENFANGRGRNTREILLRTANLPVEGAVPGIPFLRTERAKELIVIYHLH